MLSNKNISIVALCAALNVTVGSIVYLLKVPIYLDSIGTILCAFLLWPNRGLAFVCAALAGVLSFAIGGLLVNPFLPWFSLTVIAVAFLSAFITARSAHTFRTASIHSLAFLGRVLGYGVLTGIVAAAVSAPVVVYLFGGVTGSGSAIIVAFFLKTGHQLMNAALLSGLTAEPVDKTLQVLVAVLLFRATPEGILNLFRQRREID